MAIKVSLKTKTNKKIEQSIEDLKDGIVKVGWVKGEKYPENDMFVAEVAYLNENGHQIKRDGKVIARVPPRPFLAITMSDNGERWNFLWKKLYRSVLNKEISFELALKKMGEIVRDSIKNTIWSNVPPPNTRNTIRQKQGRTVTLVDTGRMIKNINYVYEIKR